MRSTTSRLFCSAAVVILASCLALVNVAPAMAELVVTNELPVGVVASRILPDRQPDRYWVVGYLEGLILLTEDQPGVWLAETFSGYQIVDAVGPTSTGLIYCTYVSSLGSPVDTGIVVFDSGAQQFTGTIDLPWEDGLCAIAISPDEERLYVTILTTDEGADSPYEASENSGLVVEVDIASGSVLRTCSVRAWPETIFLWNGEAILVSCQKQYWEADDDRLEFKSTTDIIALDTFTKVAQIPSNATDWLLTNDFMAWDESLVALLNVSLYSDYYDPMYEDGIWLIDPVTGTVADTIRVTDRDGNVCSVKRAYRSRVCEGLLYVTMSESPMYFWDIPLIVTDTTGAFVDFARTNPEFTLEFIYELDDGRLMVTDPINEKVLILEWVNHPPICALELLTPMPYVGPSPALIEFSAAASYDPDPCDELTYEWDFDGDGLYGEPVDDSYTGPSVAPTHAYTENYRGYVYLKVSDGRGGESICEVEVSVTIQ